MTAVPSGAAALEALSASAFEVVVIDFAMPGMNGADTAALVRAEHPGLPILFITGRSDLPALRGVSGAAVLQKPFLAAELVARLRLLLGSDIDMPSKVIPLRREAD